MARRWSTRVIEFSVWWAGLLALYLVLISTVTPAELVVGAVIAGGAALAAVGAAGAFHPATAVPRLRWRYVGWLPLDMARDAWAILGFVVRYIASGGQVHGSFDEVTIEAEKPAPADALRAYGVLLLSLTPGSYVTDDFAAHGSESSRAVTVRVHRIGGRRRFAKLVEK